MKCSKEEDEEDAEEEVEEDATVKVVADVTEDSDLRVIVFCIKCSSVKTCR